MTIATMRQEPLAGFKSVGLFAMSKTEIMGDPCQLFKRDEIYEDFMNGIMHLKSGIWHTVVTLDGTKIRVLITGMDGGFYGTGTDTATIVRMKIKDWERLRKEPV
jgi:hypothetical protein